MPILEQCVAAVACGSPLLGKALPLASAPQVTVKFAVKFLKGETLMILIGQNLTQLPSLGRGFHEMHF